MVPATAKISAEGRETTEHVTYDLSKKGVRLCGIPDAEPGDSLSVLLELPYGRVSAPGYVVRTGSTAGKPDFAIDFIGLHAQGEDMIERAVRAALVHPQRRSLLLCRELHEECAAGWGWLGPVLPLCATATSLPAAREYLWNHTVRLGIISSGDSEARATDWMAANPRIPWRAIDEAGCLHPVVPERTQMR